jgi:hypothetical protein
MIEKHIPEQFRELGIGLDALAKVVLHKYFNVKRKDHHSPARFSEHSASHPIGIDIEVVALGQDRTHHCIDAAEQSLVFELLIAKAHQGFKGVLIPKPMIAANFKQFRSDEPLDKSKDVGVCAALNLADEALLASDRR